MDWTILNKRTRIRLHILKYNLANMRRELGAREELEVSDSVISVHQANGSKCAGCGECVQSGIGRTKLPKVGGGLNISHNRPKEFRWNDGRGFHGGCMQRDERRDSSMRAPNHLVHFRLGDGVAFLLGKFAGRWNRNNVPLATSAQIHLSHRCYFEFVRCRV